VGLTAIVAYVLLREEISFPNGWIGIFGIVIGVMLIGLGKDINSIKAFFTKSLPVYVELHPIEDKNKEEPQVVEIDSVDNSDDAVEHSNDVEENSGDVGKHIDSVDKDVLSTEVLPDPKSSNLRDIGLAFSVGVSIAAYSISYKLGVYTIDPVSYIFFMNLTSVFLSAPYIYWKHKEECINSMRDLKLYIVSIGCLSCGTYLAILFAFQLANVSYIVAIREFSVVIGSILGIVLLKEKVNLMKCVGIATIATGLVLLKLA